MKRIYICGLAQVPGPYDRMLWMQVYGAHDTRRSAEEWVLMEVEESGIPGQRSEEGEDGDEEQDEDVDPAERQHFEDLDRRTFYFIQEKVINSLHEETWRLMPDRTWKKLGG